MATKKKTSRTRPLRGFVIYNSRSPQRMYSSGDGSWWHEVDKAKVYPTEREASLEVQRNRKIASGYESYEAAAARSD
jgi:hypothetical protein